MTVLDDMDKLASTIIQTHGAIATTFIIGTDERYSVRLSLTHCAFGMRGSRGWDLENRGGTRDPKTQTKDSDAIHFLERSKV